MTIASNNLRSALRKPAPSPVRMMSERAHSMIIDHIPISHSFTYPRVTVFLQYIIRSATCTHAPRTRDLWLKLAVPCSFPRSMTSKSPWLFSSILGFMTVASVAHLPALPWKLYIASRSEIHMSCQYTLVDLLADGTIAIIHLIFLFALLFFPLKEQTSRDSTCD